MSAGTLIAAVGPAADAHCAHRDRTPRSATSGIDSANRHASTMVTDTDVRPISASIAMTAQRNAAMPTKQKMPASSGAASAASGNLVRRQIDAPAAVKITATPATNVRDLTYCATGTVPPPA